MEKLSSKPNTSTERTTIDPEKSKEGVVLGKTKDGMIVYDRNDGSHVHSEGGLTPELIESALSVVSTDDKSLVEGEVNFDGIVGKKTCVEVGPDDEVVMVYRKKRPGQTPMVKNRQAEPSNKITVVFRKSREGESGDYVMLTTYIGDRSEKEPWDLSLKTPEEREKSKRFWKEHALVYDESLVDQERTRAFENMSEEEKELELMSDKVYYEGLFINSEDLPKELQGKLSRKIAHRHVTLVFNPKGKDLMLEQLGREVKIRVVGYGNDGKNEGLLVELEADDPVLQEACDALEHPHITISISPDGKAKDTADLEFEPLEEPFVISGRYGLFSQGRVISDSESVEELKD